MRDEVKKGYEKGDYEGEYRQGRELQDKEKEFFRKMFSHIPDGGRVLDLGCGTGVPFDRYLADKGCDVVGVDIAEKHVERARENVPEAEFVQGDFFDQDFDEDSFDAIVSFYAIFHIPREEHSKLLEKIRGWLKDDGVMLITMGASEMEMDQGEIGGSEMYWSSYGPEKNRELVKDAGFSINESYIEDWREETHLWLLAEPDLK